MSESVNIHFLGAAGTVTGSKYLIESSEKNILIDCGLFQGIKKLRELNWSQLPIKISDIDMVVLTHGHLDHSGFLPNLVKMGYRGPIWATAPTIDIAKIILEDSAKIQEEEAEKANKEHYAKHNPAKPLYTLKHVEKTIPLFEAKEEGTWLQISDNIRLRFQYNGHILGATFLELDLFGKHFVFSGDVGRPSDPLLRDPTKPGKADILFLESTYGDRLHPRESTLDEMQKIILETYELKGTIIIPSFAVERAQLLIYLLWQLRIQDKIPLSIPIILDSPMGADVLKLFQKHTDWHKLNSTDCTKMCNQIRITQSFKETWEIIDDPQSKIIIAGSGMVTGGRVLTYLEQYIDRPETTVLLAGYQAEGTRGRQLLDGLKEIKFYGKYFPVKARIEYLEGLSGHADQNELLNWLSDLKIAPEKVYLVHGEPQALDMFRVKISDTLGWKVHIPELFEIDTVSYA
jgi:metallo-beta-lactamase family protein